MSVLQITWTPTPKQLRLFALTQVVFFAILSTFVFPTFGQRASCHDRDGMLGRGGDCRCLLSPRDSFRLRCLDGCPVSNRLDSLLIY